MWLVTFVPHCSIHSSSLHSNLGANRFPSFPSKGLSNVLHLKVHNNPLLVDFPGWSRFPRVRSLVLSYAYHCCQFMPSTYENVLPDYGDFGGGGGGLQETVFFPGEGNFDHSHWHQGNASDIWSVAGEIVMVALLDKLEIEDQGGRNKFAHY